MHQIKSLEQYELQDDSLATIETITSHLARLWAVTSEMTLLTAAAGCPLVG